MINTPEWLTAGEPKWTANTCPDGWRLPTQAEFESLINSGRTWADANTRGNALDGVFFGANHATATIGNMQGCIFLPALGVRSELDGSLGSNLAYGLRGGYWSNTSNGVDHTTGLTIAPNYINVVAVDKLTWAQSVRCVQDATGAGAGTIISGLKWANTNVAQPRTFAIDSDTHTEFYQWNRDRAWAATGDVDLDEWKEATQQEWVVNPCPEGGWRVPTQGEFDALINSGYTWANANAKQNAVSGMFFGRNHAVATMSNMQGCIFLPACGSLRDPAWTSYDGVRYWSSTQNESDTIYGEHLSQGHILGYNTTYPTHKRIGRSIRCVRGVPHPSVNGVVWAETNLTADGTFASRPDTLTNFFQWSRNEDLPATGTYLPSWNSTPITATEWADDPCPDSWRLPTQEELQALISSGGSYAWYDMPAPYWRGNAVNGMFFGSRHTECSLPDDMVGCIFLPASGGRQYNSFPLPGKLYYSNSIGYYWSSTQHSTIATAAHGITFDETDSFAASSGNKLSGYNIRCVYDPKAVSNPTTQSMSTNSVAQAETSSAAQTDSYKAAQAESYSPTPKEPFISMLDTVNAMSKADRAALISTIQAKLSHNTSATPAKTDMPTTLISKAELATATLYPNPVINEQLTINNGELAIGVVEVLNNSGAVVHTQDFGRQTTGTLQLQGLQGTYFIRIGKSTQSIVVAK